MEDHEPGCKPNIAWQSVCADRDKLKQLLRQTFKYCSRPPLQTSSGPARHPGDLRDRLAVEKHLLDEHPVGIGQVLGQQQQLIDPLAIQLPSLNRQCGNLLQNVRHEVAPG